MTVLFSMLIAGFERTNFKSELANAQCLVNKPCIDQMVAFTPTTKKPTTPSARAFDLQIRAAKLATHHSIVREPHTKLALPRSYKMAHSDPPTRLFALSRPSRHRLVP